MYGMPSAAKSANGRLDDFSHDARVHRTGDDRGRRVRAHAAGVGSQIRIEQSLVILGRGQGEDVLTVSHDDEAGFLSLQEFLNDDFWPASPNCPANMLCAVAMALRRYRRSQHPFRLRGHSL